MKKKTKLVIVDDELLLLEMCRDILSSAGFECVTVNDSRNAFDVIGDTQPDLVITDLQMPHVTGMDLLGRLKDEKPELPVIILTGHGTIENAVSAIQSGADDYCTKPFNPSELCHRIQTAMEKSELTRENRSLKKQLAKTRATSDIVGQSKVMHQIFSTIERAAPTDANVMIIGESGTGKEMIARSIHRQSRRMDEPFVPVDCVSIPDQLIESEIFGHEKGAFTGATESKEGLFESANGGTLFLDEITEMNFELQGKLLRVLQERKFRRVGGREFHDLNVRLIAATNRNPQEAITQERLRLDLYYRLNVIPVELPPLRDRADDVVHLIHHFLGRYCEVNHQEAKTMERRVLDALLAYDWPGNVRELQNLMERLVILSPGNVILLEDLPPNILGLKTNGFGNNGSSSAVVMQATNGYDSHLFEIPFKQAKKLLTERFEVEYLTEVLGTHRGNISAAARSAGIDRKTIHRLVSAYGISAK